MRYFEEKGLNNGRRGKISVREGGNIWVKKKGEK